MKFKTLFIIACSVLFLTSCSQKIIGTWNVDKYQMTNMKGQDVTTKNAGQITFDKDGTGEKSIEYNIFSTNYSDVQPFEWRLKDNNLTINGSTPKRSKEVQESDFNKTWIVIESSKKKQLWKSTDGSNGVQIIELTKK